MRRTNFTASAQVVFFFSGNHGRAGGGPCFGLHVQHQNAADDGAPTTARGSLRLRPSWRAPREDRSAGSGAMRALGVKGAEASGSAMFFALQFRSAGERLSPMAPRRHCRSRAFRPKWLLELQADLGMAPQTLLGDPDRTRWLGGKWRGQHPNQSCLRACLRQLARARRL